MSLSENFIYETTNVRNGPYETLVYLKTIDTNYPKCRVINGMYQFNTTSKVIARHPVSVVARLSIRKKRKPMIII